MLLSSRVRRQVGGRRGEERKRRRGTPPDRDIDQGQSRISVEDLYQSIEVRARRGTALTTSVPPRLFPEKRRDVVSSLSLSLSHFPSPSH